MSTVPLLDRDGEVEIARALEDGEWLIFQAMARNADLMTRLLAMTELADRKNAKPLSQLVEIEHPISLLDQNGHKRIAKRVGVFEKMQELEEELDRTRRPAEALQPPRRPLPGDRAGHRPPGGARLRPDRGAGFHGSGPQSGGRPGQVDRQPLPAQRAGHQAGPRWRSSGENNEELRALHRRRIQKYREEVRKLELRHFVKQGELRAMVAKVKRGEALSERAKEQLIMSNLRLVVSIAKKYTTGASSSWT